MTSTVLATLPNPSPSPGPPDAGEGDESDETEVEHKNKAEVIRPTNNNNDVGSVKEEEDERDEEEADDLDHDDHKSESSSAHTDSENDEDQEESGKLSNRKKAQEEMNMNELMSLDQKESLMGTEEKHAEVLVKVRNFRPATPGSPRLSISSANKKKLKESCDEEETSSDDELFSDNGKGSYVQLRLRRKTLLKIEKFTDSDSRSRERMRSRALSPPTSSDEENLHIGWVAYPAALSGPGDNHRKNSHHRRQRAACACAHALKCIFSPVTKVCQKCRVNNKVWDSESLQEKLLNKEEVNEATPVDNKKFDI